MNENGSVVYTFEFEKKNGELNLISSKYYNINNPNYSVIGTNLFKLENFSSVKNKAFKNKENVIIRFNTDTWLFSPYPNVTGSFYECGTGGWKGNINGLDYFGFSVKFENQQLVVVQRNGDKKVFQFEIY